ncbi:MAG: hypothetical protein C0434_13285 [Xanthomonadaceae bacterium]|nr:hypothetical protein [Xanthomonadaceae bacterium]
MFSVGLTAIPANAGHHDAVVHPLQEARDMKTFVAGTLALLLIVGWPSAVMAEEKDVGRDWSKIDTNKDGFISPEEMEKWLKANPGPQK